MAWISPLQLRDYSLIALHVETNESFTRSANGSFESAIGFDFDMREHTEKNLYRLSLTVLINKDERSFRRAPYRISITLYGIFESVEKREEAEKAKQLLFPNGLAILYSIARGIVGQATGTAMHEKFVLPMVNFFEVLKDKVNTLTLKKKSDALRLKKESRRGKK